MATASRATVTTRRDHDLSGRRDEQQRRAAGGGRGRTAGCAAPGQADPIRPPPPSHAEAPDNDCSMNTEASSDGAERARRSGPRTIDQPASGW